MSDAIDYDKIDYNANVLASLNKIERNLSKISQNITRLTDTIDSLNSKLDMIATSISNLENALPRSGSY
jgi:hypothetical protein